MADRFVSLKPAPSVHARLFDGELVILDLAGGEYFALDAIGSRLWRALESGQSIDDVAKAVVAEYDVTLAEASADLEALAEDLTSRGLLVGEKGR
jgi:Coenzyme PQQ synthesis protein D (PqqD)